jgi:hypothetical protein
MVDTVRQILDKIDNDRIFVPAFQREYVWKRENVKELFRSLINEYPTGTLLTWETSEPPELKGNFKHSKEMGAIKLLLDGQQRVTSIYIIMNGEYPPYYTDEDIKHDVRKLYINLDTLELEYYKAKKMENNFLWADLTDIFTDKIAITDFVSRIEDKIHLQKIMNNFMKIKNIEKFIFPEQTIPVTANIKNAIDIFYMVNAMGVNLTEAELALAQISGYWPEARQTFKDKLMKLKKNNFDFKLDFIIYLLLGIIHTKGDEMQKLHTPDNLKKLKEVWESLSNETLDYVIKILKSNYVESTKEINSVYALVPIVTYVHNKNNKLSELEIKKMIKWFYYSQVKYRYISQLPQKLTKDLTLLKNSLENKQNPFDNLLQVIKEERNLIISEYEFENATTSSPLFGLMKFYFKSKGALSFDGVKISELNHGTKYSLENDHIFPYSLLAEKGYKLKTPKYGLAQEITNRAIVTQKENRTKSNKDAFTYLTEVKNTHPTALKLQLIPEDESLWEIDNYEAFLKKRRSMLAKELNKFLEGITESLENEIKLSILDLVNSEEGENLEFKSTLAWNIKGSLKDKKIENESIETIAGFNNKDGGTLIIGVDDNNNVLGIEEDYGLANLKDRDKFELHLKNILRSRLKIENEYIARKIKISFENLDDKDICVVEVERGDKPVFTEEEAFFLRDGNSTIKLKPSEVHNYIKERF